MTIISGPVKPAPLATDQPNHGPRGVDQDQLVVPDDIRHLLIDQYPPNQLVTAALKTKTVTRLPGA